MGPLILRSLYQRAFFGDGFDMNSTEAGFLFHDPI
ncbi:hypothetical protein SAMN06264849_102433 [Melghirimyces algeriensis]|uniref:Uncharacterized protein n=1 Tax=Melghirimyces algeriensis TaxID=910412 RepID=A0A521BUK2_9BACL|nr:hypothetical protein SAMN06264849_102433 [Melghirimyces algeriensis]